MSGVVVGRDATRPRRPRLLALFAGPTFGDKPEVVVPWSAIEEITQVVKLKKQAADFGLGTGDDRAAEWVGRIPLS